MDLKHTIKQDSTPFPQVKYLSLSDPIYESIEREIYKTYKNACIMWIEKVFNHDLQEKYNKYKNSISPANEMMLFHGTDEDVARKIIKEGFDPKYGKTFAHGVGCYFSTSAAYSKNYCKSIQKRDYVFMLFCSVVTGNCGLGRLNTPIPKNYHSVTDSMKRRTMYVVDKTEACLPIYLISFYPNVTKK